MILKPVAAIASLLLLTCSLTPVAQANITLTMNAGNLYKNDGTTLMPVGGLLQLVCDTSGNGFSVPTSTQFIPTGSDDVILKSFALNGFDGIGTSQNVLTYDPTTFVGLDPGDPLQFRWFPNLTLSSTAPGTGTNSQFGVFRTVVNQDGSNLVVPWGEPSNGATRTLSFLTISEGGSNADALGIATLTVTAVPEPSTYTLFAGAFVGLIVLKARQRRRGASVVS